MIHLVMGGSLAGKTTFVQEMWIRKNFQHRKLGECPVTLSARQNACAIGHYGIPDKRTCGVDQLGRDFGAVHRKVTTFLINYASTFADVAMEGNALMDDTFMGGLAEIPVEGIKLWLINPSATRVNMRAEQLKIRYGRSILALSYRRAFRIWNTWKGTFQHEMVTGD